MKILVFTEGTVTKHPSEERRFDVASFIPTEGAAEKLTKWWEQGAEICYLTSERSGDRRRAVEATLRRFNFPAGEIYYRRGNEDYVDVVRQVAPDVLVEDDCQSIGWDEVITPKLKAQWGLKGVVIPENGGLAHLPDDHQELLREAS